MEYTQGQLGRIFVARLHEDELIQDAIHSICIREGIRNAVVYAVGGIKDVETGAEHELVGIGTVIPEDKAPKFHFHAGIGNNKESYVGNPKNNVKVSTIIEAVIMEIEGIDAMRLYDEKIGAKVLTIVGPGTSSIKNTGDMKGTFGKSYK